MRQWIALFILVLSAPTVLAETKIPEIKSWKTFENEYGYEVKYPDCWKPDHGYATDEAPLDKSSAVLIKEGKFCARPRLDPEMENGIEFEVRDFVDVKGMVGQKPSPEKLAKLMKRYDVTTHGALQRKEWLIFQKPKFGDVDAVVVVELQKGVKTEFIRWKWTIYCPNWWVEIHGPQVRNPGKEYYDKFKAGDLAVPEPEKTIIESFRCTDPKLKPGMPYGEDSAKESKKKK